MPCQLLTTSTFLSCFLAELLPEGSNPTALIVNDKALPLPLRVQLSLVGDSSVMAA